MLTNVIKHAFGVLKARLPVFKGMTTYTFWVQRNIVIACTMIRNLLRKKVVRDTF